MRTVRLGRFRVPFTKVGILITIIADLLVSSWRFKSTTTRNKHLHRLERAYAQRTLRRMGARLTVEGAEHVDRSVTYLVVALHESLIDPLALQTLGLDLRFLARTELANEPIIGRYIESTGHLLVDPEQGWRGMRAVLRSADSIENATESLVLFPQGSVLGIEIGFQPGLDWLANKLGWPILPVVITGGHRVWEHPFTPTVRFDQPIHIAVLQPIPPDQLDCPSLQDTMKAIALANRVAPARHFDPVSDGWWDGYAFEIDPAFPELKQQLEKHRMEEID